MNDAIRVREAAADDVPAMLALIFEHGVNPRNFLPQPEVRAHLDAISSGATQAVLALAGDEPIGFVSFMRSRSRPATAWHRQRPVRMATYARPSCSAAMSAKE